MNPLKKECLDLYRQIDVLKAEIDKLRNTAQAYAIEIGLSERRIAELKAENERLREALRRIDDAEISCDETGNNDSCDMMQEIAQQALAGKEEA